MAERKKKGKKNGAKIGNGLLPIEHEAGHWAGVGAGGRAGRWAQARVAGVQTGALALGVGAGALAAGERQRRWATQAAEARRRWGAQASGTAWERGALVRARQGDRAHGRGRQRRAGPAAGEAGACGAAGWAACARLVCAAGPGWVFWCT